ncbi:hypothetical protein GOB94_11710 [Granulicella sp. 5B5]|uniref:YncE family protein n=1 Tax=Granulicella sp. 5B5 TaxID=1617967 RepID=UPI0015F5251F|nr:hypothetical protein [Granulicella sp. 5B5]QMV19273.1 hypothetical protein GOB94_11710 [Granulicella sp. 5B5]
MNLRIVRPVLALAILVTTALPLMAHAQYKVLNTYTVGNDGGWDYLTADSTARRLYVARSGPQGALYVYSLDTFAQVGKIDGVNGHGAVIDDSNHHGFATSNPVTMFDADTLKVIKTIDTGGRPDGFLLDPVAHRAYILSHAVPNVTVLNTADGSIVGKLDLGGEPEQSQLDGHGHMYTNLEDKDAIAVIDTNSLKVINRYDISSKGGGCAGLAMDTKNGILFASCRDKHNMIILNAADGKVLDVLPSGVGSDGVSFNPKTMEAFSTQGDGTLTIVKENSPTSFAVEQTVATPPGARTNTLDLKTGHLITVTSAFGPLPPPQPGKRTRAPMLPGTFKIIVIGK